MLEGEGRREPSTSTNTTGKKKIGFDESRISGYPSGPTPRSESFSVFCKSQFLFLRCKLNYII